MGFPEPRLVHLDDVSIAVYSEVPEGPRRGDVVFVHGFPELAYSWRHQLAPLAAAGFGAHAIDLRGYGASSKPDALDAYRIDLPAADVAAIPAALGLTDPVVVGHDWGSLVMFTSLLMHPGVYRAAVTLNVPYRGWCSGFPSIAHIEEHEADRFGYVLRFQEPGATEAFFAQDPDTMLRGFYSFVAGGDDFMTDDDFATYRSAFVNGGLSGALNYYRNIDANLEATAHLANAPIEVPLLVAAADADPVLPLRLIDGMERWCPQLTKRVIAGSGHWVQQEQPDAVNAVLLELLDGIW